MPLFRAKRLVAVPAGVAYAVAVDVTAYKEFLPLLEESHIVGAVSEEGVTRTFRAELAVGYSKLRIREKFTSTVVCDDLKHTVTATSQEPPFRNMKTVWTIGESSGQAEVNIEIDYSMRNPLLQVALGGVMEMAVNKAMIAFENRARSAYAVTSKSI
jgi:ribosome-associated toxin RatA of RatAB toxin-antitoxin module